MSNELKKQITKDLEKTGFPLEVLTSSELDKRDWTVYPSCLYKDPETLVTRELDIHAVNIDNSYAYNVPVKPTPRNVNKFISHLVIQCRKSDKPWVFFDNGRTSWPQIPPQNFKSEEIDFHNILLRDIDKIVGRKNGVARTQRNDLESLGLKKHRYIRGHFHKSHHEAFSSPNSESKIYESLITVVKALEYFKNCYGTFRYSVHLFIPVIVFDGTLWSASIKNKKGDALHNYKLSLKKVDGLFVVFERLTPLGKRKLFFEEEQIVEIITHKALRKKLDIIESENKELYKCWTKFINRK
ncbi:MAG: hypothetical protein PHY88_02655 [Candidatus Omnitrophica bacterium]|nr:hypothetical protein [Candidatus Omnitrophota bacterium]